MDLREPPRRGFEANLLPMINVVFLLLIFFLISARLAPPEPFAVAPPEARAGARAAAELTLYLGADGALGFRESLSAPATPAQEAAADAPVLAALAAARAAYCAEEDCAAAPPPLALRADQGAPVARLARLMRALGASGFARVDLITAPAPGAAP